jgi:hypothetical protein
MIHLVIVSPIIFLFLNELVAIEVEEASLSSFHQLVS